MAKQKAVTKFFQVPAKLNPGLRIADVKKKVGEVKDCVFRIVAADHNAEGVLAIVKHLSSIGLDGPACVANAVNSWYATSVSMQADAGDLGKSITIVPRLAKFGEVNKAAVAGARVQDFITEHGRAPDQKEYAELYSGLSL